MSECSSGSGTEDDRVVLHGAIEGSPMAYACKPWAAVNVRSGSNQEIPRRSGISKPCKGLGPAWTLMMQIISNHRRRVS